MSGVARVPGDADEVSAFMDGLRFDPGSDSQQEAALLDTLPNVAEIMVVRSLRLPLDLDQAVSSAAQAAEVSKSTWIRQAIETALGIQSEEDEPISRADALCMLTLLRPVHPVV